MAAETLSALRRRVAAIEASGASEARDQMAGPRRIEAASRGLPLDGGEVDALLGGGLAGGRLHEIHPAAIGDIAAAEGFALALSASLSSGRPVVWIRQDHAAREAGELHAEGLAALGLDPAALILARLADPLAVLRAGVEAARCSALSAVLVEPWGEPKALDLTTQRRFSLAAEASGVTVLLLRPGARPMPGQAETRWQVSAGPAEALAMGAPGHPTFDLKLLRHRRGSPGGPWRFRWNRDERRFEQAALLRDPAALPRFGPAEASPPGGAVLRLAG